MSRGQEGLWTGINPKSGLLRSPGGRRLGEGERILTGDTGWVTLRNLKFRVTENGVVNFAFFKSFFFFFAVGE